jgi:hypothetical protein
VLASCEVTPDLGCACNVQPHPAPCFPAQPPLPEAKQVMSWEARPYQMGRLLLLPV